MIKFPLIVIYAIIAFNITVFATLLQLDVLIFHAPVAKAVTWGLGITAWVFAYINRSKFLTFRFNQK